MALGQIWHNNSSGKTGQENGSSDSVYKHSQYFCYSSTSNPLHVQIKAIRNSSNSYIVIIAIIMIMIIIIIW